MQLPLNLPQGQLNTKWKSILDPVIADPIRQGQMLQNVVLSSGKNAINHGLQRNLTGWFIVGINAIASIYDEQASNQTPQLTLVLVSNSKVTVNLWVF